MGSAATARFPAPAVSYPVVPSQYLRAVLVLLYLLAISNLFAWFHFAARPQAWVALCACAVWVAAALASAVAFKGRSEGRLVWDTGSWSFENFTGGSSADKLGESKRELVVCAFSPGHAPEPLGLSAEVAVDLQKCMWLRFGTAMQARWFFVSRRHDPVRWLALRRAVYSSAAVMRMPNRSDSFAAIPSA